MQPDDLNNIQNPFTLAFIALIVGGIVRILKTKKVGDWLDALPVGFVNRIPKRALPWLATGLGVVIAYLDLVLNAHLGWKAAIVPSFAGVLAGAAAVGGHETLAKFLGQFIYQPKGPSDPQGPLGPDPEVKPPIVLVVPGSGGDGGGGGMSAKRVLAAAVAVFAIAVGAPGCAGVVTALPAIIATLVDAGQIIDTIDTFVRQWFLAHPDASAQAKVSEALVRARGALNVLLRAANGAKDVNDAKVDAAFNEFKIAYIALLELTKPYGVQVAPSTDARMQASSSGDRLTVPQPLAFKPAGAR